MLGRLRVLALLLLLSPAAGAAATLSYDGLFAFGDSLSDNGNAYELSFGQIPESPPYFRGRFSDGPVWYDHVARAFRAQGRTTRNYAIGGAWAQTNLDPIPDLYAQRRIFRDRVDPGPDALAAVWAGGNDLLDRIGEGGVNRTARGAADAVTSTARSLHRGGVDTALIFNLPNFAHIPRYVDADAERRKVAARGSKVFNARLRRGIDDLRARGMTVIEVDTFALFADVRRNPSDYGIDNLTEPCLQDDRNRCSRKEARASAFFDTLHPSATLHAIVGEHVLDLIDADGDAAFARRAARTEAPAAAEARVAPVPLPAPVLPLLVALGGLALIARRRTGAA